MTINTAGYTLGSNMPLHYSRILWDMATGVPTSTYGGNPTYAANDYTHQRWAPTNNPATEVADWIMAPGALFDIDTILVSAHDLGTVGAGVQIWTAPELVGPFTWVSRGLIASVPSDDTISFMFNNAGAPYNVGAYRVTVPVGASSAPEIGVIRGGKALQMMRPLGTGLQPIGLRTEKTLRHADSETGQPLVRTVQRRRKSASIQWGMLGADWYRSDFQPFAETLPEKPFGLIQNAVSMDESAVWAWVNEPPMPTYQGGRKHMEITLNVMGYDG